MRTQEQKLANRERANKWYWANRERALAKAKAHHLVSKKLEDARNFRLRNETFFAYGNKCECCGECRWEFLSIDHIDGKGAQHKRNEGITGGLNFYSWLKRNGFPKDNYRLLCHNCNCARGFHGYCPHPQTIEINPDLLKQAEFQEAIFA